MLGEAIPMKAIINETLAIFLLLSIFTGPLPAQDRARPCELPALTPNLQNLPVNLDIRGDLAVIVENRSGEGATAVAYGRDGGGTWSMEDLLANSTAADEVRAVAVNESREELVVAAGRQVMFYTPFARPDWVLVGSNTFVLPENRGIGGMVLEGDRLAIQLNAETFSIGGADEVFIYERSGPGASWVQVATTGLATPGELFDNRSLSSIDLSGTRLVVGAGSQGKVGVFERDFPSAGSWGRVALIDGSARGLDFFGGKAVLDGDRIAVTATDAASGLHTLEAFSRNSGGADAWGRTGRVFALPPETRQVMMDADAGRLALLGLPSIFSGIGELAQVWIFGPGGGATGWQLEARHDLGRVNLFLPPGLSVGNGSNEGPAQWVGISGEDLMVGLADEEYFGGGSSWAAVVHRRNQSGANAWGQSQLLDGTGQPAELGSAVSIHGTVVAAGMPDDAWLGASTGSVMLWRIVQFGDTEQMFPLGRLVSPAAVAGERFGESVSVWTDDVVPSRILVAVGAPGRASNSGAAYIFSGNLGSIGSGAGDVIDPLTSLDAGDEFGASVAVKGFQSAGIGSVPDAHLAVGAPGDDSAALNAGSVYVFREDKNGAGAWGREAKADRPAGVTGMSFGTRVAIVRGSLGLSGTSYVAATRPTAGTSGQVAILSESSDFGVDQVLDPPAGSPLRFAASVAGDFGLAVGATGGSGQNGAAYLYVRESGTWSLTQTASGTAGDGASFGFRVATALGRLVVGAPGANGFRGQCLGLRFGEPVRSHRLGN